MPSRRAVALAAASAAAALVAAGSLLVAASPTASAALPTNPVATPADTSAAPPLAPALPPTEVEIPPLAPDPSETAPPATTEPLEPEPTTDPGLTEPAPTDPAPEPTEPNEPAPSADASTSPVPVDTPTPAPTPDAAETPAVLEPVPPAAVAQGRSPVSWGIAALVLVVAAAILALLRPRERPDEVPAPPPAGLQADTAVDAAASRPSPEDTLAAMEAVGEAMLDAGYSVTSVGAALEDVARASGYPATEVVAFPTALFVSSRGLGEVRTGAVASGQRRLLLHQVDELDTVITAARTGRLDPVSTRRRVDAMRELPPPYSPAQRVLAYLMLSAGLSVLLGASWSGVGVAAVLGAAVGWLLLRTASATAEYQALITVGLSFGVSTVVLTLTTLGLDPGVLPSLIAPLVTLLPGGLLTTGVIELSTGQMMAGAGRLAAGAMQLALLAAGVTGASALVGVPRLELDAAAQPIGPLGPWLSVAVFGVGVIIYQCGRRASIGWILLVLHVAYGAQVLGDVFFGGVLSGFIGALVVIPVTVVIARHHSGPSAFVSFLPAFWLLVPGALGLVGVTSILDGDVAGLNTLLATASTMVAIALGTLAGSALSAPLRRSGHTLL